jgi:hypothetical protein
MLNPFHAGDPPGNRLIPGIIRSPALPSNEIHHRDTEPTEKSRRMAGWFDG